MVVTYGRRHRFEMWLGFSRETKPSEVTLRLRSRPSEDPGGCVSRITSRLEAAGIRANALTEVVPEERGVGPWIGRKVEPSMVTIPI
jgi:hypothetical protein